MNKSLITVFAALAATVAVPAGAATVSVALDDAPVAIVTYDDLVVASPAGAAALDSRIGRAVDKVCQRPDLRELKAVAAWKACQEEARDGAMEQLSLTNPFDAVELASNF